MIVDSDEIIKNKPKDCKLCPRSLCGAMTDNNAIHIYRDFKSDIVIYPPCADTAKFLVTNSTRSPATIEKFSSLLEAVNAIIERPECDLEKALQLTKIKNMIGDI